MAQNKEPLTRLLKKDVKDVKMDAHCSEIAVVIKYDVEASVRRTDTGALASQMKHCQKILRLKELSEGVDIAGLARYIIKQCPVIPEYRLVELEQILYYLQKRQRMMNADCMCLYAENAEMHIARASMNKITEYMELLYEDVPSKTKASGLFLELNQDASNLKQLVSNGMFSVNICETKDHFVWLTAILYKT